MPDRTPRSRVPRSRRRENQGQAAQAQQAARDRDPNLRRQMANTQDYEFQGSRARGPSAPAQSALRGPVTQPGVEYAFAPPEQGSLRGPVTQPGGQTAVRGPVTQDGGQTAVRGPVTQDGGQTAVRGPVTARDQQIPPDDQFNQMRAAPGTTAAPPAPTAFPGRALRNQPAQVGAPTPRIDENNPPARPGASLRSQPAQVGGPAASEAPAGQAVPATPRSPSETLSDMVASPEPRRNDSGLRSDGRTDLRGTSADVDDPRFQAQREQDRQAELPGRLLGQDRNPIRTQRVGQGDLVRAAGRGGSLREDRLLPGEMGEDGVATFNNESIRRREASGALPDFQQLSEQRDLRRAQMTPTQFAEEVGRQPFASPEERNQAMTEAAAQRQAEIEEGGRNLRTTETNQANLLAAGLRAGGRQGDRPTTPGQSVVATFAGNPQLRENLQNRYGTEDAEEIANFVSRDIENRWRRTDPSRLPDYMTDEGGQPTPAGQQIGQDLTSLDLALSDREHIGMWRALTGAQEMGSPVDFNTSIERLQDFVVSGEQAKWVRGARSNFGGRTFKTGDLPGEARQIFDRLTGAVRNSILLDDSEQGARSRLQLARNERRETLSQIERDLPVSGARRKTLLGTTAGLRNLPPDHRMVLDARDDAIKEMYRRDRVPLRERERRRPAYEAELDRMIGEWRELEALSDVEYADRIRQESLQAQTQGQVDEELARSRGN